MKNKIIQLNVQYYNKTLGKLKKALIIKHICGWGQLLMLLFNVGLILYTVIKLVIAVCDPTGHSLLQFGLLTLLLCLSSLLLSAFSLISTKMRTTLMPQTLSDVSNSNRSTVGELIELLPFIGAMDVNTRLFIIKELAGLLPLLRASDYALISAKQRHILCQILAGKYRTLNNQSLLTAALSALQEIGDKGTIFYMQRLAAKAEKSGNSAIQEAAQQCLIALQNRVKSENNRAILVRPLGPANTVLKTNSPSVAEVEQIGQSNITR